MLCFASCVMIVASFWSLLQPAVELAEVAVSLQLNWRGVPCGKASSSGTVELVACVLGERLIVYDEAILQFALSFTAGAMNLVAVHELIPECQLDQEQQTYFPTMGIIAGFVEMMLLDVILVSSIHRKTFTVGTEKFSTSCGESSADVSGFRSSVQHQKQGEAF